MRLLALLFAAAFVAPAAAQDFGQCAAQCNLWGQAKGCTGDDCAQYCNDRAANNQINGCFRCLTADGKMNYGELERELGSLCQQIAQTRTGGDQEHLTATPAPEPTTESSASAEETSTEAEPTEESTSEAVPTSLGGDVTMPIAPAPPLTDSSTDSSTNSSPNKSTAAPTSSSATTSSVSRSSTALPTGTSTARPSTTSNSSSRTAAASTVFVAFVAMAAALL